MSNRDNYGFSTGLSFGKFEFRKIDYEKDIKLKNTLLVSADEKIDSARIIKSISYKGGKPVLYLIETK
jgi:hypothetical protein